MISFFYGIFLVVTIVVYTLFIQKASLKAITTKPTQLSGYDLLQKLNIASTQSEV